MWTVARALGLASTKIVLTFIVAIFLIMLSILFYPEAYLRMDDFANWLANLDLMRNPSESNQSNAVVRLLINEATIFGVVTTLTARILVELAFLFFGGLWRLVNPPEEGEEPKKKSSVSFY